MDTDYRDRVQHRYAAALQLAGYVEGLLAHRGEHETDTEALDRLAAYYAELAEDLRR